MAEKELKSLQFGVSGDVYKVHDVTARTNIEELKQTVANNLEQVEQDIADAVNTAKEGIEGQLAEAVENINEALDSKQPTIDAQNKLNVALVEGAQEKIDAQHKLDVALVDGAQTTIDAQHKLDVSLVNGAQTTIDAQHKLDVSLVNGAVTSQQLTDGLAGKQATIDAQHKLDVNLVDGALTSSDLEGLATKEYVNEAITGIQIPEDLEHKVNFLDENLRKEWVTTENYLPYDSFTNDTCKATFAADGGDNTGALYSGSTFCGWYGGVGHPQQIDWVEFNIVTRADAPVTKVWASIAVLTREVKFEDYDFSATHFAQCPRIGNFSQFVTGCKDILIYDDAEHPLEGNNVSHTIRWELPESFVNTEDYEVIIGYTCNNFINGGYKRFQVNKHKGLYEPWIHYSTWNPDTNTVRSPITSVIGVPNESMGCTGKPYDDNTGATPRWSYPAYIRFGYSLTTNHEGIKTDSIIEDFTTNENFTGLINNITGDAINNHDYQPAIKQTFETMGLTEQLEKAQVAAELIEPATLMEYQGYSPCDLVAKSTNYTKIDTVSTFTGECQPIGPIPANVAIGGFRVPFIIRSYNTDTDPSWRKATKAGIRLYECDSTMENNTEKWITNNPVQVREKIIDVDLDLDNPEKIQGVYDFVFDEPYYNTKGKHLYLSVWLGARFHRTYANPMTKLKDYLNTNYNLGLSSVKSFYTTEKCPTNPSYSNRWQNENVFAYSIIKANDTYVASDMFKGFVDDTTTETLTPIVEGAVEGYMNEHPFTVPPQYEVRLAKKYYAVQGDKIQLFYDGCIKGIYPSATANITVRCAKGAAYPRYWEFTPSADDVGTSTTLTLYVRDHQGKVISKGSTTIVVTAKPSFSSPTKYNMLGFGDSLTSSGTWFGEGMRRLVGTATEGVSGPASWKIPNLTLDSYGKKYNTVNTHGTYHEGYGGWTWASFLTSNNGGSTVNGIFVNLTTATEWELNTVQHSIWVDQNNKKWKLEDFSNNNMRIKFDRGSGNTASQNDTPLPTQLTCSTLGLSLTTSDITSVTWESGNPFYDNDTARVNFLAHAAELGHEPADIVGILLTWNGGGADWSETNGWTHQGKINAHINNATTLLRRIHEDLPNAKIIVMGIQLSSITGGNGANYGANGSYSDTYGTNYYAFDYDQALENLVTNEEFGQYCYYGDTKAQFDTADLMPYTPVAKNTRSSNTEPRGTNGVHPSTAGYYAIGDAFFRCLCKVLNDTKANYEGNNV